MRLQTALAGTLIITLVALLVAFPLGVSAASVSNTDAQSAPLGPQQVITVQLTPDGDALWTVESYFLLEDDDDVESFESFADAVTSGDRELSFDDETFDRFVTAASRSTDRHMQIEHGGWDDPRIENVTDDDVSLDASQDPSTPHRVGVLSYSVTWTNLAERDGSHIFLGDAFGTDDHTWFPALTEGQQLVIERPSNFGYEHHEHSLTDGNLVWTGPHEFDPNEFSVTYLEGAGVGSEPPNGTLVQAVTGLALVALLAAAAGYGYVRHTRPPAGTEDEPAPAATDTPDREASPDAGAALESPPPADPDPDLETPPAGTTATFDERDGLDEEVDLDLLSDEERVHRLLRGNQGRMKQASIVTETGWSNAKVSQLLSKMDDDGDIEKLRIGRENLITLPEVDPTELD
ncbi:helix-turn-helix transcriptional regulator [Natronobiforma cellulositropha]|uniref:helix-turn-helix transcriptional regulator n=1 Tax=Natronobiforma cellulositropha TaxID=1679076 RepID=UPI0021D5B4B1|nr:hypothetical protein [Natronobiforma cellulositropha]